MSIKPAAWLLAGFVALAYTQPGFAADETKEPAPKAQNAEHQRSRKGSDEIRSVQQALKDKGEDPGAVDGIMGKKTRAALRKFQQQNNLKVTGTLDQQTAEKLGVKTSSTSKTESQEKK